MTVRSSPDAKTSGLNLDNMRIGACQTCAHDTGRCGARPASVDDLVAVLINQGAVVCESWEHPDSGYWYVQDESFDHGRYLVLRLGEVDL